MIVKESLLRKTFIGAIPVEDNEVANYLRREYFATQNEIDVAVLVRRDNVRNEDVRISVMSEEVAIIVQQASAMFPEG